MRVAYLTAGAGGMYCGSCLRDNTLAAALKARGRDVLLIPLYTPIRTDEADVSEATVYYGGINVFLQQASGLFARLPFGFDRLLDRPGLLRRATRRMAATDPAALGPLTVSVLRGEDGAQRRELRKLMDALSHHAPDVVHLPNAMFLGTAGPLRARLDAAVVCTLSGEDVFIEGLPQPFRGEALELIRAGAAHADAFVCVSRDYAGYAAAVLGASADRITVVPPGIRAADFSAAAPRGDGPFRIGYLARLCREKGLHVLADAFIRMRRAGRDCRLTIAGYVADAGYVDGVRRRLADAGLEGDASLLGEVDRDGKRSLLASLHAFSVPAVFREAKGLYVLEALAAGVPVVEPEQGAFPELLRATGGGLLVPPGDPAALAEALGRLMDDEPYRLELARRGRERVQRGFTESVMAERVWDVFGAALARRRAGAASTRYGGGMA